MESLFATVANLIAEPITPTTIVSIVIQLMQFVEKVQGLSGAARKQLILDVLTEKVNALGSPELTFFVTYLLPELIDSIIAFDRGELKIVIKKCKGFCC